MIQIQLNGESHHLAACTLEELLIARGWHGKRIAVERNGAIVPKSSHAATRLEGGDTLEIVVAVGGG